MACLAAKPVVDGLEKELEGRATFLRANIQKEPGRALARRYGVELVPAMLVFDDRGSLILKQNGVSADAIRAAVLR